MEEEIVALLHSFGWSEGFHIPVANEENRILESKLEEALKNKREIESLLRDMNNNLSSIKQYQNSIIDQRSQNEQMLVDYRRQVEEEERSVNELHLEKESLISDSKQFKKQSIQLQEENKHLQLELDSIVNNCNELEKDVDWSKDMEEFLDENINEENNFIKMLEKFNVQNLAKFEQTELKRVKLVDELNECKNLLHQKQTETNSLTCQLKKSTKLIEELRSKRQWLISQWESSVAILRTRDTEIEDLIQEINIVMGVSRGVESKMMEYKSKYKEQKRMNMEEEIEIQCILRQTLEQKSINAVLIKELEKKTEELLDSRNELTAVGAVVSEQRSKNTLLKREINTKYELAEKLELDCQNLTDKIKNLENRSLSAVDRIKQLQQILQSEKERSSSLLQERQRLDRSLQQLKSKNADLDDKCMLANSEMKQLNNVKSKLFKILDGLQTEIRKYEELLSATELKLREVSSRIRYFKEDKSDELKMEAEKELAKLTDDLNEKKKTLDSIRSEINKCLTEIKLLNKETHSSTDKLNSLKQQKEHLCTEIEISEKHVTKIVEENKEKEVTENMLRLRAYQLEKALCKTGGVVLSLEKQKVELETLMRERLIEIEASSKTLKIRKKALTSEVSNLKRNIDQASAHVTQLMKKYEIIMENVGKDDNGESLTIANYRVRLVKERFALLEKGDDLDEKIKKAEKEIQALENTLLLLNVCNKKYKESFSPIDFNSKEYREKEELEQEYNRLLSTFRKHKRTIPEISSDIETLKTKLSELRIQDQHLQRVNAEKLSELSHLEREVNEQYVKLQRVDSRIKSLKKSLKTAENVQLLERDFLAKELQSINKTVLNYIADVVNVYPETEENTSRYLNEKGIVLPTPKARKKVTRNVTPSLVLSSQTSEIAREDTLVSASITNATKLPREAKMILLDAGELLSGKV